MNEPEVPSNARHLLFSISLVACLLVGLLSGFLALIAANNSNYLEAAICLIPSAISFGLVMFASLMLIKS